CFLDIENFIINLPELYVKDIEYINIDPFIYKLENIEDLIKLIPNNNIIKSIFFKENLMLYITNGEKIYGIDLKVLKYIGFNFNDLIVFLKNSGEFFIDSNNEIYNTFLNTFTKLSKIRRSIIYFL